MNDIHHVALFRYGVLGNLHHPRRQPRSTEVPTAGGADNEVELAYRDHYADTEETD